MFVVSAAGCAGREASAGSAFTLDGDQLLPATTTVPRPKFNTVVATSAVPELQVFEEIPDADCLSDTTDTTIESKGNTNRGSNGGPNGDSTSETTAVPWMPTDGICPADEAITDEVLAEAQAVARDAPTDAPATTTTVTHPPIPRIGLNSVGSARNVDGWTFSNPTFFENPLVMVVTEEDGDWLKVRIASRPNETEGWIRAADVTLTEHRFHMQLTLSNFTLKAWEGDRLIAESQVVIGTDHTRTPTGQFFISEKIPQSYTGGAYGPWIFSTNGYSEDLDLFDGGLPVIAMHGTNQPQLVGTKSSNGCIRVPNEIIEKLASTIPAGTPLEILP